MAYDPSVPYHRLDTSEEHIGQVGYATVLVTASVTRPANTDPYTAGDVIANSTTAPAVITFTGSARVAAGSGSVFGARLIDEANQATKGSFELYLFSSAPAAVNDNAALALNAGDVEKLIGVIAFDDLTYITNAASGASGNVVFGKWGIIRPFKCPAGVQSLFGLLVVRNAYTPVSGEKFVIQLGIIQD